MSLNVWNIGVPWEMDEKLLMLLMPSRGVSGVGGEGEGRRIWLGTLKDRFLFLKRLKFVM